MFSRADGRSSSFNPGGIQAVTRTAGNRDPIHLFLDASFCKGGKEKL